MLEGKKMEDLTFDEAMEQIKALGDKEKQTVENAEELARIINDLANARVKANLTQRELAEKSGLKQSAIARMESLQVVPRLDTVIRVAKCLDVQLVINSSKEAVCNNLKLFYSDDRGNYEKGYWYYYTAETQKQEEFSIVRRNNYAAIG